MIKKCPCWVTRESSWTSFDLWKNLTLGLGTPVDTQVRDSARWVSTALLSGGLKISGKAAKIRTFNCCASLVFKSYFSDKY